MDYKELTWIFFCVIWIVCFFIPSSEAYDDNLFFDSLIVINRNNDTIPGRVAAFGPRISDKEISGVVIPMKKIDPEKGRYGCDIVDIKKSTGEWTIPEDGFIALIERGHCSFSEKVRNMQKIGAKAVIVGNNNPQEYHLITMYGNGDTSDITIPSLFILHFDMDEFYREPLQVTLTEYDADWPVTDIFMMTTLLPIIFLFGIFIIYKFRIDSFDQIETSASSMSVGAAPPEVVNALPIKIFSSELKKERDPETCAVCIEDFKDDDELRVLPCRHEYHVECIDPWLITRKRFCPICKRSITGDSEEADENTPLLAHNNDNDNNTFNNDNSQNLLNTEEEEEENHIININEEENQHEQSTEVDSDDDEPLINLIVHSSHSDNSASSSSSSSLSSSSTTQ